MAITARVMDGTPPIKRGVPFLLQAAAFTFSRNA